MTDPIFSQGLQEAAAKDVSYFAPKSGLIELKVDVCKAFGITAEQLENRSRMRTLVMARKVFSVKARVQCHASLKEIGRALGGRDHTTIMHYLKTFPRPEKLAFGKTGVSV